MNQLTGQDPNRATNPGGATKRLRVLESFQQPRPTTNPYIVMLYRALQDACDVHTFSWRFALQGKYDVFHVHWPEILLRSDRWSRRVGRRAAFLLLLGRLKQQRVAVVRTMHNLAPHEEPSALDNWLLARLDAMTTAWIRLNPVTDKGGDDTDVTTILLGHYLDWFTTDPGARPTPKKVGNFGLIRPYKGVPELVTAFRGLADAHAQLVVMGQPNSAELTAEIERCADHDPRITLQLNHVDDPYLAEQVRSCSLVVLPHHNMHNSSSLLLALSLGRPALVPDTAVTRHVQEELGSDWVHLYSEPLTPAAIETSLAAADQLMGIDPRPTPDLSDRDWSNVARAHVAAFRRAMAKKTDRRK